MSDDSLMLTRRRLLAGALGFAGASAAAGAGTMAALSDTESSNDNAIEAGTLDLKTGDDDLEVTFLQLDSITPGDSGNHSIGLRNHGTVDGVLEIDVDGWKDSENGIVSGEAGDSSSNRGELQEYLKVNASIGIWSSGWYYVKDIPQSQKFSTGVTIQDETTEQFTVDWDFEQPSSGNAKDAQSDSVSIDLSFRLVQDRGD